MSSSNWSATKLPNKNVRSPYAEGDSARATNIPLVKLMAARLPFEKTETMNRVRTERVFNIAATIFLIGRSRFMGSEKGRPTRGMRDTLQHLAEFITPDADGIVRRASESMAEQPPGTLPPWIVPPGFDIAVDAVDTRGCFDGIVVQDPSTAECVEVRLRLSSEFIAIIVPEQHGWLVR